MRLSRFLDPIDRIPEVLFGIIMVLTITSTISVYTAGRADVATMILGALGCNLAWGIIDGGFYLLGCLEARGRHLRAFRAVQRARDVETGRRVITGLLPDWMNAMLSAEEIEALRHKLYNLSDIPIRPHFRQEDWFGAIGVFLLVFGATMPPVLPFLLVSELTLALRMSNGIGIGMLFICGYAYGHLTGLRPWPTGLSMVAIGTVIVGIAIALGG